MTQKYIPTPDEIPSGICECGCGQHTKIAPETRRERRHFEGHPMPFMQYHSPKRFGADHPLWKGGRFKHPSGYIFKLARDHPAANRNGYIQEHRLVAESTIGRYLTPNEVVHHINGLRDDNRPENLVVLTATAHNHMTPNDPSKYLSRERMSAIARKTWDNLSEEQRQARVNRMRGR